MADKMAIVGAAGRFPGAADLATFGALVAEGGDAIREVDPDRWPASRRPGVARGGFLETIEDFDALAFSMSPAQAAETDPQQRLMIEVAVEAIEDARLGPADLTAHDVGVYIGIGASEYDARFVVPGGEIRGLHSGLGNDSSFAAGRIASLLGLRGPAVSLNTACSSALVAVEHALRDLRTGTCAIAVVGAVNLLVIPENSARLERMGVLAPDGRCKPFDRAADGYGRAEGAGAIVLTTGAVAEALGLRARAHLLGAAVNQDAGETGLTAPNARAQTAVIGRALADAGLDPDAIDVVEAHGTGTPLGDPIELEALGEVFGDRPRPLPIGSAKSNVGHLEVAAGMAGLLKGIAMLEGERVLPHRIHEAPVSLPRPLCLAGSGLATESDHPPRTVGISAFGLSGTNAHVVIGRADPTPAADPGPERMGVLVASASGPASLRELAGRLVEALDRSPGSVADLAASSTLTRRPLAHRLAVLTDDPAAARAALVRYAAHGKPTDPMVLDTAHAPPPAALVVGRLQGDWSAVIEALAHRPVFADAIDGIGDPEALRVAVAVGIARLWQELGLRFRRIEGWGEGRRAAAVIRGECTVQESLQLSLGAADEATSTAHDDELIHGIGEVPPGIGVVAGPDLTWAALLRTVAQAWCRGSVIDWEAVHGLPSQRRALPPTPWQRVRAWVDDTPEAMRRSASPSPGRTTSPHLPPPRSAPTAFHRREWRPLSGLPLRTTRRRWVLVADHRGVADALARTLQPPPRILQLREPGATAPKGQPGAVDVDASDPRSWRDALGDLDDVAGLLFLAGLDQRPTFTADGDPDPDAADDAVRATWLAARWARTVLEAAPPRRAANERMRFLLASRGAVACTPEERVDPTQAALWGLGGTLALEHPELGVGTVDLDPSGELGGLVALLGVTVAEDQVALRGDMALAARLGPCGAPDGEAVDWGEGPVLVTGGHGALGLHVAEALAERGVRTVWLASRRSPDAEAAARIGALRARGTTVASFSLDVAEAGQVRAWAAEHTPTGWIHAAGVVDDGIALHLTPERTLTAMRPKVHGALALAQALDRSALRAVALCSSVGGLLGAMGQANHAAANTWLDAFAEALRCRGVPAVSVALGPLLGSPMAEPHLERLARAGVRATPLADAARAVVTAPPGPSPVAVVDLDLERLGANGRVRPILQDLVSPPPAPEPAPKGPRQSREALTRWIVQRIASDLGLAEDALERRRPLAWHGFDSLMAIELKRGLDAELGTSLPSAPFLSSPSVDGLVDALAPMVIDEDAPMMEPVRPSFVQVPTLTALQTATTGPALPAVRLYGPSSSDQVTPLPVAVQVALAAAVLGAVGLAWFLL